MNRYAIIVFWSKEDGAWVADVPDVASPCDELRTRHPGRSAHAEHAHAQSRDLAADYGARQEVPDSLRCAAASGMTGGAGDEGWGRATPTRGHVSWVPACATPARE
jgi:hypothetical protein